MKDFLKYIAATFIGLILFGTVFSILGVMSIVGMIASSESTQKIKENSVLVIDLNGVMLEQADDNISNKLSGNTGLGLRETLSAIQKAKTNKNIKGIYLNAGALVADMAQLEELRNALEDFKQSKKWIIAYGEEFSQPCYYLASAANKVYMNPQGSIDWHGIGGQMLFLKDTYAKIGIKMIPFKCGKYKSATEMYTEDHMSRPNREQTERYIGGWWQTICRAISKSRGISMDTLNAYADRVIALEAPENMVRYKMVDALLYQDQVKEAVKKALKLNNDDMINQVSVSGMANVPEDTDGETIAVYYAYGTIVNEEEQQNLFFAPSLIAAKKVCKELAELAEDDDVKAVVLRINSGGGSAYASEQIWRQVELLKGKKPVVVSMGGAAASGGYYISSGANYIFAQPTTITGSIGIFGITRDRSDLMTRILGIKYDEVKTNRNANMGSEVTPMTAEQAGYMQRSIDRGYKLFKARVAQGRHMTPDKVEANAQGHVFLGSDALKLGLVDGLGGLNKAVAKAAELAKIKKYHTANYPAPLSLFDQIINSAEESRNGILDEKMRMVLGNFYEPFMLLRSTETHTGLQARMPFMIQLR